MCRWENLIRPTSRSVNYPQMLRESLWIFVDICGYLWIFVDICGYLWIFVDICGYSIQSYLHAGRPGLFDQGLVFRVMGFWPVSGGRKKKLD